MALIIGYNLSHDSSLCLVDGGQVRAAAALERSAQIKRGVVPAHAYAAAMTSLTREILSSENLRLPEIDYWIATSTESRNQADEDQLADSLGLLMPGERRLALPHPGHHLAHAAAAFYTSGFDEAAALVIDAYGSLVNGGRERETGFMFRLGKEPKRIFQSLRGESRVAGRPCADGTIGLPETLSGVGEIYRVVTLALGFFDHGTYDDAGKTMGLAPYGKRLSQHSMFIEIGPKGLLFDHASDSLVELGLAIRNADGLRLSPRQPWMPLEERHRNVAAQVQAEFEEACAYLAWKLLHETGSRSLVLGGGCFLNAVLNARLRREAPIERLFIFPAATDDGNAVGAALYAHHVLLSEGTLPTPTRRLRHLYLGPSRVSGRDIAALAKDWGLLATQHGSPQAVAKAAAWAIAEGKIVGWFQDRGELGPRALGARSILCHPGIPGMKDALNKTVKFREPFRPFAGSVLAEQAGKWFEMADPDSPFMLMVWPAVEIARHQIGEIVHIDGTCRVQTVDVELPGPFRALIEEFNKLTGIPVVLNTSFNLRGKPIIERVEEALDCLYGSRLSEVFIGTVEVPAPDHTRLRPLAIGGPGPTAEGLAGQLLAEADGGRTMDDLATVIGVNVDELIDLSFELRRFGRLRWEGLPQLPPPRYPLPQYEPIPEKGV